MSKCFIEGIGCSGGGSAKLPAIYVQYPEGSICTCTNGDKTYTAKDTTGFWLFAGLSIGTWTVTATDPMGENEPVSETVEITTEGQSVDVELSYFAGYYYNAGDEYIGITGGWIQDAAFNIDNNWRPNTGTVTKNTDSIALNVPGAALAAVMTKKLIDLRKINTLILTCTSNVADANFLAVVSDRSSDLGDVSLAQVFMPKLTTKGTVSLDVSAVNEGYIVVCASGQSRAVTMHSLEGK